MEYPLALNLPNYEYNEVIKMYKKIKNNEPKDLKSLLNVNHNNKKVFELLLDVLKRTVTDDAFISIDYLVSCGVNLKMTNENDCNALHVFLMHFGYNNNIEMITSIFEILMEYGVDLFKKNNNDQTVMNILLFGYKMNLQPQNKIIFVNNPRYKFILNEIFERKLKEKRHELIINIVNNLTKLEFDELYRTLYTNTIRNINILLNGYSNSMLNHLENKNIDSRRVFHKNQLGNLIIGYLNYKPA